MSSINNKVYFVYSILYRNKCIYIGKTNNIVKRRYQHQTAYRKGADKELYNYLRSVNYDGSFDLVIIQIFSDEKEAIRYEAFLVLRDYFSGTRQLMQSIPNISKYSSKYKK